jgi:hypothetical protein
MVPSAIAALHNALEIAVLIFMCAPLVKAHFG